MRFLVFTIEISYDPRPKKITHCRLHIPNTHHTADGGGGVGGEMKRKPFRKLPERLFNLLSLPQVELFADGYNSIKSANVPIWVIHQLYFLRRAVLSNFIAF